MYEMKFLSNRTRALVDVRPDADERFFCDESPQHVAKARKLVRAYQCFVARKNFISVFL